VAASTVAAGSLISLGLAVDAVGGALITGTEEEGLGWRVVAYERPAGSSEWSGPISVSAPAYDTGFPSVAANESGQAMVAWKGEDHYGDLSVTRAAFRRSDGTWEAPQNLGYGSDDFPAVAIDARGDAVVVWTRGNTVYAESRPAGGAWGPAVVLSQGYASGASVVMNRRGDAFVVWASEVAGSYEAVSSFRRAGSSSWMPPSRIPLSDSVAVGVLSVALDESANVTVVGQRTSGEVEVVTRAADAADWSAPVVLGNTGGSYPACAGPLIALDEAGDALVVWGGPQLHSARRKAGSTSWANPVVAANVPACTGSLAVDPNGDAAATLSHGDRQLDATVFDATPPILKGIVIPRVAHLAHKVRFTVTASDLWSPLASPPLWRFGDGSIGHGSTVQHAYRRTGRYRVTVTAIDQAGNAATSTATVRVTSK
jgi:PKD domain